MNNLLPRTREIAQNLANKDFSEVRSSSSNGRKWRIALYPHDTMGLGHKRRNLLIAQTLACSLLEIDVLMISGIQAVGNVPTPLGVDCLTLPALYKNIDGQYQARRLDLSLQEIKKLRSQVILATMKALEPDIFIVDNVPRGPVGELDPTLDYLRTQGKTHCILGLRDVLDEPATVQRDWRRGANEEAIQTYYHAVWVYGDSTIYDLAQEYKVSDSLNSLAPTAASYFWAELQEASKVIPDFWSKLAIAQGEQDSIVYQAAWLAREAQLKNITHLHAHFGTVATSVARLASHFTGIPYTFTAHAKDIFHESVEFADMERKLKDAATVVTVSDYNLNYLQATYGVAAKKVQRIYNGLDLRQLQYSSPAERPPLIISVCRLIEKKGVSVLIDACAILKHKIYQLPQMQTSLPGLYC